MSGGGGGGYGGPTRNITDCNIVERVPLNSPQAAVLAVLQVGTVLDVEVVTPGPLLVAKHKGQIAGSLTPQTLLDLLDCIAKGRVYVAQVVLIRGGLCEVEVRPR